jgi:hypothetical protein
MPKGNGCGVQEAETIAHATHREFLCVPIGVSETIAVNHQP